MKHLPIILCLLISSCTQRNVQLPKVEKAQITDVKDHSSIYIFFDEDTQKAELNRTNLITSTHWIFHIDQRNAFEQVAQHIDYMQTKKANPMNPHNNPNSQNFFSVADTTARKLGFINFTQTRFAPIPDPIPTDNQTIVAIVLDKNTLLINGEKIFVSEFHLEQNKTYLWVFNKGMIFQDFMHLYTHLQRLNYIPKSIFYQKLN